MGYQGSLIRGDFPALRGAVVKIKKLTVALPRIAQAAAPELRAEVQRQFNEGTNPYRTKWKPLAPATLRKHGPPPLTDSGSMRAGITVVPMADSIVFSAPAPAGLHQNGWGRRAKRKRGRPKKGAVKLRRGGSWGPRRQIFPDGRVPNVWRRMIRRVARIVMGAQKGVNF